MKTVVITGSTRGLGWELAKQFRKRDYHVVLCGTSQAGVDRAVRELEMMEGRGKLLGRVCDVSHRADVEALADAAVAHFRKIDLWINNAGINQSYRYAWELGEDEVSMLLDVDLKGAVNGTTAALQRMIAQGYGAVYNVEGMGSNDAFQPCFALYGTAKRAVTYYTDAVAREVKAQGLPVIVGKLSPGIMITDFLTSAQGKQDQTELSDKVKKVYNILGDKPDVIAEFLADGIVKNKKNGAQIAWLTNKKAAWRFATSAWSKRDFFG